MLTRKQQELLFYIDGAIKADGVAPTYEQMRAAIGAKSRGHLANLLDRIEERGFIRRIPQRARAIEVLRLPDDMQSAPCPTCGQRATILAGQSPASPAPADPVTPRENKEHG